MYRFAFRTDAERAKSVLNGALVDDRPLRVDWDQGFSDGRQYGRGKSGGQMRDDYRTYFDPDRGGFSRSFNPIASEKSNEHDVAPLHTSASEDVDTNVKGFVTYRCL